MKNLINQEIKTLKLVEIKIGERRALGDITELAASIKEIGLLNPVTVSKDYMLIAGHHRLKAYELLGIESIPIRIIDCTALQTELAEIDENMIRNNGTELEQCMSLARRKEIYLELHPETKNGGDRGNQHTGGKQSQNDTVSFCQDTAKKTGKSKRTVERKASNGKKLKGMVTAIKAAGIDDSQKDLTELAKLNDRSPEQAQAALAAIVAGKAKTVKGAMINQAQAEMTAASAKDIKDNKPVIYELSYRDFLGTLDDNSVDLLFTDPPYSTNIADIEEFIDDWLFDALDKVNDTGRAYICIGAYPLETSAYINKLLQQTRFIVDNPLIWTYRNTLGVTPKDKYNLNYQVILHLYQKTSHELNISVTNEMFSVQDINAPDARIGDRYHTWQKPEELALRLIKHSTCTGDTVLDPFTCTGTFPIAASKLNRIAIGCDISPENLKIAEARGCHVIYR